MCVSVCVCVCVCVRVCVCWCDIASVLLVTFQMEDGLFLDDLETLFMPPEERSQYFPTTYSPSLDPIKSGLATSGDEGDSGVSEDRSPPTRGVVSAPCSPLKGHSRPKDLFTRRGNDEADTESLV